MSIQGIKTYLGAKLENFKSWVNSLFERISGLFSKKIAEKNTAAADAPTAPVGDTHDVKIVDAKNLKKAVKTFQEELKAMERTTVEGDENFDADTVSPQSTKKDDEPALTEGTKSSKRTVRFKDKVEYKDPKSHQPTEREAKERKEPKPELTRDEKKMRKEQQHQKKIEAKAKRRAERKENEKREKEIGEMIATNKAHSEMVEQKRNERKDKAAVKIQAAFRGFKERKEGNLALEVAKDSREILKEIDQDQAARKIQGAWLDHKERNSKLKNPEEVLALMSFLVRSDSESSLATARAESPVPAEKEIQDKTVLTYHELQAQGYEVEEEPLGEGEELLTFNEIQAQGYEVEEDLDMSNFLSNMAKTGVVGLQAFALYTGLGL